MDDHDHGRMTDEGCPHDPPDIAPHFGVAFDFGDAANAFDAMVVEISERFVSETPIST